MTLNVGVTDDELGQYFRRAIAIADRLGKSLPFESVMDALQRIHDGRFEGDQATPVTKPASRSILRCLKSDLAIPATNSPRTFAQATDIFPGGIYGENCNVASKARPETPAVVYELIENGTLQRIFEGQGVSFDQLCWEPEQVIQFVINHREHLHSKGYATFFPLSGSLVALIYWRDARRLKVNVHRLAHDFVWSAGARRRAVLPQLALKP